MERRRRHDVAAVTTNVDSGEKANPVLHDEPWTLEELVEPTTAGLALERRRKGPMLTFPSA
jgi:hypothetical protein